MRQTIFASALLAALALDPRARAALPASGLQLEICRLPGTPAEYSGQAIRLPAGTVFTAATSGAGLALSASAAAPPVQLILAAPAVIDAAAFCVRAPVRPADPAAARALQAEPGDTLWISARPAGTFDRVYGLLRRGPPESS